MRKTLRNRWKRACSLILAAVMVFTMIPAETRAATSSSANTDGTFDNPVIYADVPDIDIIRVGNAYYMVSTTMHLSPGCPIMKSTDLVNWEIVNYVYDILGDTDAMNLRNGESMYGNGQWATSLKYHNGIYYVAFNSNTTKKAYLYTTDDIEKGSWTKTTLNGFFHDLSLFFDDDGKGYLLYGGGQIKCAQLSDDYKTVKTDTEITLFDIKTEEWGEDKIGTNLAGEGTHIIKKGEYYYVFNICWPEGGVRTEVCHRSKTFPSTQWENKIILKADFQNNGVGGGVAQGAVIDTPDDKWYGFMFQDHGAIGRTPILTDCVWKDGWPMLGKDGDGKTVEAKMTLPATGSSIKSLVKSDEFYNDAEHRVFEAQTATEEAKVFNTAGAEGGAAVTTPDDGTIQLITNGNLETGTTDGWTTTPGETACNLEAVDTEKASGSYSLFVSGRQGTGSGACQNVSGKMEVGKTYTISGKLKYTNGPDTKDFIVTLQHGANYNYRQNLVTIHGKKGEWVDFKGTYTAKDKSDEFPFDPQNLHIFVETSWTAAQDPDNDLMDYYLDDFSVTVPNDNLAGDSSFMTGLGPWVPFENHAKVELVQPGYGGADDKCLKVSERTAGWHGPAIVFGDKMKPGSTYILKARVKYDAESIAEHTINFTMKGTVGDSADPTYPSMASVTAKTGEWTEVTGKWTMPEDATNAYPWTLYVNADEKNAPFIDFYLDDVSIEEEIKSNNETTEPGEHDYNGSNLDLVWQWNHNPNNNNWSLTEREGWLRLKTGSRATSLLNARNTLTQRTFGPACSGTIRMDISNMKKGDVAGLGSLSYNYGYIAVKKGADSAQLVMVDASGNSTAKEDKPVIKESVDCTGNIVYLKEDFNYAGNADGTEKDTVTFYYSFDGKTWNKLGSAMKMTYELVHFMGSKFAIFNYATDRTGGYVDVDYFKVSDQITGTTQPAAELNATMTATPEVSGVMGAECEVKLYLDELKGGHYKDIEAAISIPGIMSVDNVVFNSEAIKGRAIYEVKGSRLYLKVKGNDVSFAAADKLFATIKLKVDGYVSKEEAQEVKADYIRVDGGASEYDVTGCIAPVTLKHVDTKAIAKKLGYGNPIFSHALGADPYAMEYDGRVYVYMTADDYQYDANGNVIDNNFSYIKTFRVVSSADLMNWTDHGEIPVAGPDGIAKWANNSWAPAIAHKEIDGKEKFFLYFADGGTGIGVLEGDSPLGPWRDPLGQKMFPTSYPDCADGVVWCFDPAVLVDSKGDGYIYFGGGIPGGQTPSDEQKNYPNTARVAKLAPDMVHVEQKDGKSVVSKIDAPCMFEDSGIFEYNGKYYYSYCSNFSGPHYDGNPGFGNICYMVSDNPMGPFTRDTYAGEIFSNPSVWFGTGGNNHHATFVFEGESYFIYHAQTVAKEENKQKGYRSTHIDKIEMRSDGSIKEVKGTYAGIPQLHTMNPYERIDAETIAWNAGVNVVPCEEPGKLFADYNTALTDLQDKDWTAVSQLEFGEEGAVGIKVNAASAEGGRIEVRLDSPEGTLAGTVEVPATGGEDEYEQVECDLDNITGTKNVFLVFRGSATENIMNVDYYEFVEMPIKDKLAVKISKAEQLLAGLTGTEKTNLQSAVNAAKAVLNKAGATDAELQKAFADLEAAVNEVQKPANEKLSDKIAEAKGLLAKLTGTAKTKLQAAIDAAEAVLNNPKSDQFDMEEALAKLSQSVNEAGQGTGVTPPPQQQEQPPKVNEAFTATDGLSYKVTAYSGKSKTVTVTGISKKVTSITIPDTVSYKKEVFQVTAIGNNAFTGQASLKSVVIGKNVTSIGAKAFYNDKNLAKVTFKGTTVKTIGRDAFKGIKKNAAFSMKKTFTFKNVKYKITKCTASVKQVTVTGLSKKLTSLNIPATVKYNGMTFKVTSINKKALRKQTKLKSVTIGKNVKSIGANAFDGDKKLAKIKFSGTAIKSIGKNAFKGIKKNATFTVKKAKKAYYNKLLKKAKTKNYKVK